MERLALVLLIGAVGAGSWAFVAAQKRAKARARLWHDTNEDSAGSRTRSALDAEELGSSVPEGRVARWLYLAGYRSPRATAVFWTASLSSAAVGLLLAFLLHGSGLIRTLQFTVIATPAVGGSLAALVAALPWLCALALAAAPTLVVRSAREERVAELEKQLPLTLELLATLAEAGMGFEAAIEEVLASQRKPGPLSSELRIYQTEQLAGVGRVACLRRLSDRVALRTVRGVTAALVQAEETGAGLAQVLRPLADDLRQRSRERALARAEALPEKLVFPLILGFLPGLLIWTLGPAIHQLIGIVDSITGAP